MKVYSPSDMADILQMKPATLRKYSALLEKYGYEIERNSQRHRYYRDKDIVTLRDVIRVANNGATIEEAIQDVVKFDKGSDLTNATNSEVMANDGDIKELKTMVHNQNEMMDKQNDLIKGLTERLDQQQKHIDESLKERDRTLMQSLNELMDSKRLDAPTDDKKGFFARLFNK